VVVLVKYANQNPDAKLHDLQKTKKIGTQLWRIVADGVTMHVTLNGAGVVVVIPGLPLICGARCTILNRRVTVSGCQNIGIRRGKAAIAPVHTLVVVPDMIVELKGPVDLSIVK